MNYGDSGAECSITFNETAYVQIHKLNRKSHNLSNWRRWTIWLCTISRAHRNDGRKPIITFKPMLWHFINWLVCIIGFQCSVTAVVFLNAIRSKYFPNAIIQHFSATTVFPITSFAWWRTIRYRKKTYPDWIFHPIVSMHWFCEKHYMRLQNQNRTIIDGQFLSSWGFLVKKSICWLHFFFLSIFFLFSASVSFLFSFLVTVSFLPKSQFDFVHLAENMARSQFLML